MLDCVYTNKPSVCSTSYLVWELIEKMMAWRDDVFFYVLYPPNKCDEADKEFLGRYPDRVTLLPLEQNTTDRFSEMLMLRNAMRNYLSPWSVDCWDFDVIISSRIPVLSHLMPHYARKMGSKMPSLRLTVGIDEMPILPFRDTVPWSDYLYPTTLTSYAMADATLINNQWTKTSLKPVLREMLSPAFQKRVLDRIHEVVPVKLSRFNLKNEDAQYMEGDFNVTFVGRATSTRNFKQVADLFRKQFSYPIGKNKASMKFMISTNSRSLGSSDFGEVDFIDLQHNDRAEFHEFLKEAHIAINLTKTEDFSLSTYETLMAGVPVLVLNEPWNAFLGPDYPFRANSQIEAYAMLTRIVSDYKAEYAKFVEWEATYWAAYIASDKNVTTSERLIEILEDFDARRIAYVEGKGGSYVEIVEAFNDAPTIDLSKHLLDSGGIWETKSECNFPTVSRAPGTLMLKLVAQNLGYKDTNKLGIFTK